MSNNFAFSGDFGKKNRLNTNEEILARSHAIIYTLIVEHVFAYLAGFYRKWEIEKYGVMDINGVYRGPKEYVL